MKPTFMRRGIARRGAPLNAGMGGLAAGAAAHYNRGTVKIVRPKLGTGQLLPAFDHDLLHRRLFPLARYAIRFGYFSFEMEGIEHVPKSGRVVFAQNHAGWFPFDAFMMMYGLNEALGADRVPFFATHEAALAAPGLGPLMRRSGALPASWFRRPERLPPEAESVGIFPEGVRGNTKPFWQAYQMRDWNRGFVRCAIARGAPIVPAAIMGGEECVPVAWTVKLLEPVIGAQLGLPLAPVPLPARWKIVFHEPVHVAGKAAVTDAEFCTTVARDVRALVQRTLDRHMPYQPLGRLSSVVAAARRASGRRDPEPDPGDDPLDDGDAHRQTRRGVVC
jgi:1-acyl-sn-glycerol-3-phosphate acyltransferase